MNCGRKLKYSGEELTVAISQLLVALSDSKYIADTTTPAFQKCLSYHSTNKGLKVLRIVVVRLNTLFE